MITLSAFVSSSFELWYILDSKSWRTLKMRIWDVAVRNAGRWCYIQLGGSVVSILPGSTACSTLISADRILLPSSTL